MTIEAVAELARRTVDRFDRLDVWVNSAGVIAYGRFEDMPGDVFRAVVETNFFGQVHAARAALPQFRRQGTGVLINMASVWGRVTAPDVTAYVTSKFAVRAFSECLRQELRAFSDVDVATMLPQAVDTPIFDRAADYAGRPARPIPPLVDAQTVALGIVRCAGSPKREVTYSRAGRLLELAQAVAPGLYGRFLPPAFEAGNYQDCGLVATSGAVLAAETPHGVEGGWKRHRRRELARALAAVVRGAPESSLEPLFEGADVVIHLARRAGTPARATAPRTRSLPSTLTRRGSAAGRARAGSARSRAAALMRIVVVGASGNVGTSVLRALSKDAAVESLIGVCRRLPRLGFPKVEWRTADVAVRILGRRLRPRAEGPRGGRGWPTTGVDSSFYSVDKAAVEGLLDRFEQEQPGIRVVRFRPGLIFSREAASEIRRLFAGPLLPGSLVRPRLIPVVPDVERLVFQAVHSRDVGEAYRLAATGDARGAFNLAAEPVIGPRELGSLLERDR